MHTFVICSSQNCFQIKSDIEFTRKADAHKKHKTHLSFFSVGRKKDCCVSLNCCSFNKVNYLVLNLLFDILDDIRKSSMIYVYHLVCNCLFVAEGDLIVPFGG